MRKVITISNHVWLFVILVTVLFSPVLTLTFVPVQPYASIPTRLPRLCSTKTLTGPLRPLLSTPNPLPPSLSALHTSGKFRRTIGAKQVSQCADIGRAGNSSAQISPTLPSPKYLHPQKPTPSAASSCRGSPVPGASCFKPPLGLSAIYRLRLKLCGPPIASSPWFSRVNCRASQTQTYHRSSVAKESHHHYAFLSRPAPLPHYTSLLSTYTRVDSSIPLVE